MSRLLRSLHGPAIGLGALVTLAVAVPAALVGQTLDESGIVDDDSMWVLPVFLVVLVAMVVGGYVAASRRPDAPLLNSAGAALVGYVIVQSVAIVRLVAQDEEILWAAIPFFALLTAAAGMTGGLIAEHRARKPRRPRRSR